MYIIFFFRKPFFPDSFERNQIVSKNFPWTLPFIRKLIFLLYLSYVQKKSKRVRIASVDAFEVLQTLCEDKCQNPHELILMTPGRFQTFTRPSSPPGAHLLIWLRL